MKKYSIILILVFAFFLYGCQGKEDNSMASSDSTTNNDEGKATEDNSTPEEPTLEPTLELTAEPTVEATPTPTEVPQLVLPITKNETGKVLMQTVSQDTTYPFNSYIISSVNGENVIVDPTLMPKKEIVDINPAAIAGTHNHPDHQHPAFTNSYDCPKLLNVKGEIQTEDFNIYSIPASHAGDTIAEIPTNVMIVFEVDGLRIVHMGDIGQTVLTKEQLTELGEIDIAFMQFENSYSQMDLKNEKGFNLIEQLNPKIIIPTHFTKDGLVELETRYGTITEFDNAMEISKEDLPEGTLNVYRILNTHKYR